METQKLNPKESNYSNRYFNGLEDKIMLLLPGEEITIKIKVKELTKLRILLESFNIEIAKRKHN